MAPRPTEVHVLSMLAWSAASAATLSLTGTCGGPVDIDVVGLAAGSSYAILSAGQVGSATLAGGPCAGTQLGLDAPFVVRKTGRADASGEVHLAPTLPEGTCDLFLQVVEAGSCATSNVVQIQRPAPVSLTLQVEDGVRVGMLDRTWGGIMDSAGDSVCWPSVTLAGDTELSLLYSNGELPGDAIDVTFAGSPEGSLPIDTCTDGGAWEGGCGTTTTTVAASGNGELCLVGRGTGWIAAIDELVLRGAGAAPTCDDGIQNQGEAGVDCGGPCPACSFEACTGSDSPYVPAGHACVWNDEFGGARGGGQAPSAINPASWTFQNLDVNGEVQNYTNRECVEPDHGADWNTCVSDGVLTLRGRPVGLDCTDGADPDDQPDHPDCALDWGQSRGWAPYTSGRVITKHKVAHQYGYIEFRARLPHHDRVPQSGMWPAVWLLGNDIAEGPPPGSTPWPTCGEFDIMEWTSPQNKMGWNALWMGTDASLDACSDFPEGGSPACGPCEGGSCTGVEQNGSRWRWNGWSSFPHTDFHVYGLLWTPERMDVFIDGDRMSTFYLGAGQAAFQEEMFLIVNLALGGSLGGPVEVTDWSTATLEVDYIRWYQ